MATGNLVTEAVEPALKSAEVTATAAAATDPITELAFGLLVLLVIISVHGWCMGAITNRFTRKLALLGHGARHWRISLLTSVSIALLTITHLIETLIWTIPIHGMGMIPSFRDAYFFVMESYTTLGAGDVSLPYQWRLLGPMIAISGLFTFTWTGSVLVFIVSETGRVRRQQSLVQHAAALTAPHRTGAPAAAPGAAESPAARPTPDTGQA